MIKNSETQITLIFIYTLLLFGYIFNRGFYYFGGFLSIILAFFLLLSIQFKKAKELSQVSLLLFFLLVISLVLSLIFYGGLYQGNPKLEAVSRWLIFFTIPLTFLYLKNSWKGSSLINKYKFQILIAIALILRVFMIISSPQPKIDVFDQLSIGSQALLQLKNPYQIVFPEMEMHQNHKPILFGYLPGSALLLSPFGFLFGDIRFAYIFADFGSVYLLFRILRVQARNKNTKNIAEFVPLIFLFNPISLFVLEQSFLEPLMTFFTIFFVYLLYQNVKTYLPYIILGLALTIKHTMLITILPLLLRSRLKISQFFVVVAVGALIVVPFILWSPRDFFFDLTAGFNPIYNTAPVYASLNIRVFFWQLLGNELSLSARLIGLLIVSIVIFKKVKRSVLGFTYSFTALTFAVVLFYDQAFANYYHYLSSLVLLLLVITLVKLHSNQLKIRALGFFR